MGFLIMSLPDYYQILQVPSTATSAEIKTAYRRLAKIFHPDKNHGNPAAEEKFKQIKDAYENLINPLRRRKYDEKRNRSVTSGASPHSHRKTTTKKNYDFSEEEAERRKYYQKHYKTTSYSAPKEKSKKQPAVSTELKYILISVPLAVALLLLIIRLYEKPKKEAQTKTETVNIKSDVSTPASPFESSVGKNIFDSTSHSVIKITNVSGYDAIVFLQNDSNKIIRHHFIENNYQIFTENVPVSNYRLYSWLGEKFNSNKLLFNTIYGNFETTVCTNLAADSLRIKRNKNDTFFVLLTTNKSLETDSMLLKKIFGIKK
jgi:curved DNA-binding protein CbpA